MTPISELATRYGSMPRSSSRATAPAASLVCNVLKTRWPVSELCTAMRAVASSRISPTMITSGSWRRTVRRPVANVRPFFSATCVWLMPGSWYSMGSSSVRMFSSVWLSSWSAA